MCNCSDRQVDHCYGLVDNTSRVKDDLSVGVDTVLCAMVLTIANLIAIEVACIAMIAAMRNDSTDGTLAEPQNREL